MNTIFSNFSNKDLLSLKELLANQDMNKVKDMLISAVGSIAAAKILKSPLLLRGLVGGAAALALGYAVVKFHNSKSGLAFRRKVATAVRDMAQETVDTMETVQDLEKAAAN